MAINQAIIRIRRGLKDELQIDKLLPGELAMATDAPMLWFCWSPGEVEQIPTSGNVIENISEIVSEYMANNDISVIGKVFMRIYNGWIQYSPDEKTWKNVISLEDIRGDEGGYYIPVVNNNGTISWQPSQGGMEKLQDSLILSKEIVEAVLGYVPLKKTDVVNDLQSDSVDLPLSAKQGAVIKNDIDTLNTKFIKTATVNVKLSELPWATSGDGMCYARITEQEFGSQIISITINGWGSLTKDYVVHPYITEPNKASFMSAIKDFSAYASVSVKIAYIE